MDPLFHSTLIQVQGMFTYICMYAYILAYGIYNMNMIYICVYILNIGIYIRRQGEKYTHAYA